MLYLILENGFFNTNCARFVARLSGDTTALRLCMERLAPAMKSRAVHLSMPAIETADDVLTAQAAVIRAMASVSGTCASARPGIEVEGTPASACPGFSYNGVGSTAN
jgi:hypothetical protein